MVIAEAQRGNPAIAARRLALCAGLGVLEVTGTAVEVGKEILRQTGLPTLAENDALHIAVAACGGVDFLLTWNLKHIAGAAHQPRIQSACKARRVRKPVICTPPQLMEMGHA